MMNREEEEGPAMMRRIQSERSLTPSDFGIAKLCDYFEKLPIIRRNYYVVRDFFLFFLANIDFQRTISTQKKIEKAGL